jgi:hypothetical protein
MHYTSREENIPLRFLKYVLLLDANFLLLKLEEEEKNSFQKSVQ